MKKFNAYSIYWTDTEEIRVFAGIFEADNEEVLRDREDVIDAEWNVQEKLPQERRYYVRCEFEEVNI